MKVNELREFYGSIGRRCRIKAPHRHYTLGLEGEYNIIGFEVQRLENGKMIYRVSIQRDNEHRCCCSVDYDDVELIG